MLDERYLPEIKTVESLHQLIQSGSLVEVAKFLKWARINLASLDPLRFAIYTKFKANLLKKNVKLTDDDLLNLSVHEIAEKLKEQLLTKKQEQEQTKVTEKESTEEQVIEEINDEEFGGTPPKTEESMIEEIVTADVSLIENEREQFRKSLLGEEYKCVIKKGNALQIKMNKKGTRIEIIVPSSWEIEVEDSLLLDLYDKRFSMAPQQNVSKVETQVKENKESTEVTEKQNKECEVEYVVTECVENASKKEQVQEVTAETESTSTDEFVSKETQEKTIETNENSTNHYEPDTSTDDFTEYVKKLLSDSTLDYYKMRSKVISYIKKHGIPAKFSDVTGGDAKIAGTILLKVLAELLVKGHLDTTTLQNRFSDRILSKIEKYAEEL